MGGVFFETNDVEAVHYPVKFGLLLHDDMLQWLLGEHNLQVLHVRVVEVCLVLAEISEEVGDVLNVMLVKLLLVIAHDEVLFFRLFAIAVLQMFS